jgi:hypothetical protein
VEGCTCHAGKKFAKLFERYRLLGTVTTDVTGLNNLQKRLKRLFTQIREDNWNNWSRRFSLDRALAGRPAPMKVDAYFVRESTLDVIADTAVPINRL